MFVNNFFSARFNNLFTKKRYLILIQTINKHSNPEAGHYIERSWGAIFNPLRYTEKISI